MRLGAAALLAAALAGGCGSSEDSGGGGRPAPDEPGRLAQDRDYPEGGEAPRAARGDLERVAERAGCEARVDLPDEGNDHLTEPVEYESEPPTSGDHFVEYTRDGVYAEPPSAEQLVHALEHGRVILQFRRDAREAVRADMLALFEAEEYHTLLTPSPTEIPGEVAASAWRALINCDRATPEALAAIRLFIEERRDRGPEFFP